MRLIDAEQIGLTDMEIIMCDGSYKKALEMLIDKIDNAPTIDAVPVIRCKNCKHYHTHDRRCKVWNHRVGREEFCSRGEWKDDPSHPFADDVMMG